MLVLEEDVFGLGHGLLDIMTFTDIHNFGLEVLTSFSWEEALRRRNLNRCVFNFFPAGCRARILVEKKKQGVQIAGTKSVIVEFGIGTKN